MTNISLTLNSVTLNNVYIHMAVDFRSKLALSSLHVGLFKVKSEGDAPNNKTIDIMISPVIQK